MKKKLQQCCKKLDVEAKNIPPSHFISIFSLQVFSCPKCPYTGAKRRLLELHDRRAHFPPTDCPECGETFRTHKRYTAHLKLHSVGGGGGGGGVARRHRCQEEGCDYAAATAHDLKSHALVHQVRGINRLRISAHVSTPKKIVNVHFISI